MRFIDKQFFNSMQFYDCAISGDSSYEEFIESWLEAINYGEENIKGIEVVQQKFNKHVQNWIQENILYSNEIKDILLDRNGKIKILDKEIYYKVKIFYDKYRSYEKQVFQKVLAIATKISDSYSSKGIKDLARLNKHDYDISFLEFEKQHLRITFSYGLDYIKTYNFQTADNCKYDKFNKFINYTVLYEELHSSDNGLFEYNILLVNPSQENSDNYIQDISVQFYDVEVESE